MKNKVEKTNEQYLRELLEKIKGLLPQEGEEAIEFFDALIDEHNDELIEKNDEITKLKEEIEDVEESEEISLTNTSELGLDTLHWELQNGNMVIEDLVEKFIESVQKKYAMLPA